MPEISLDYEETKLSETYLNAQVLVPSLNGAGELSTEMLDLLNDIKEARNTSVQVKSKSLADARRHFDILKSVLEHQPYYHEISWREGEGGSIDAQQIVTLLMIYSAFQSRLAENRPTHTDTRKGVWMLTWSMPRKNLSSSNDGCVLLRHSLLYLIGCR